MKTPKLLSESELNVIRGKLLALVTQQSVLSKKEIFGLISYLNALEAFLNEQDNEDRFGTEGWRHHLGLD